MIFINKVLLLINFLLCFSLFAQGQSTATDSWRVIWDIDTTTYEFPITTYILQRDQSNLFNTAYFISYSRTLNELYFNKTDFTWTFVDENLKAGIRYYYRILAENSAGRSVPSDVVSAAIPQITMPPSFSLGLEGDITLNLDNYVNDPDHAASTMKWALSNTGSLIVNDSQLNTNRIVNISFPESWCGTQIITFTVTDPDTFFNSAQCSFICDTSGGSTLLTFNVQIDVSTQNQARITWNTTNPSRDFIRYGLTASYGSQTTLETTYATSHNHLITGLDPETTYHFSIESRDENENVYTTQDSTFTTISGPVPPPPPDTSAVSINAYPIPWKMYEPGTPQYITFDNIPLNSELIIYTMLGDPVFSEKIDAGGRFLWNVKNDNDEKIRSGLYLYVVKSPGHAHEGKIIIIR